jgi:hypothetical protein
MSRVSLLSAKGPAHIHTQFINARRLTERATITNLQFAHIQTVPYIVVVRDY